MSSQCKLLAQRYYIIWFLIFTSSYDAYNQLYFLICYVKQEFERSTMLSSEDIKQALFRSAGYGGRCLWGLEFKYSKIEVLCTYTQGMNLNR